MLAPSDIDYICSDGAAMEIEDVTETVREIINYFVSKHHNYYICDDDTNKKEIRLCKKEPRKVK